MRMIKIIFLSVGVVMMGILSIISIFMEKPEYPYEGDTSI